MTPDVAAAGRRARSPRGQGRRLRAEIVEATERLLLETGSSEAVSIRAVADAVGVTAPSIYRHFPDKRALIFEVCNRHFAALDAFMGQGADATDDPVEALAALGRAYIDFGVGNPEYYRIMFMTRWDETPEEYRDGRLGDLVAFGRAIRVVQDCIDAGRLRPEHSDAVRVAMGFWARAHGLTSLLVSKPQFPWPADRDRFIDEYVDSCLQGLVRDH